LKISPLDRTPVLQVGDTAIFESAVILEYLEEAEPKPLHPADALRRAGECLFDFDAVTILPSGHYGPLSALGVVPLCAHAITAVTLPLAVTSRIPST